MRFQFANRATSTLTRALNPTDTQLKIVLADAERFPVPSDDEQFQLCLTAASGVQEFVRCTRRVGEELTVTRGQEGTPAGTFAIGSRVDLRLTAEVMRNFMTLGGGSLTGDIDMNGHKIHNAKFGYSAFDAGLTTNFIGALDNNFAKSIGIPNGGGYPTIGGYHMIAADLMAGLVFAFWGQISQIPSYLKLCDGTNNTPDLRNRFILGTPGEGQTGEFGGDFTVRTNDAGFHEHRDPRDGVNATDYVFLQNGNLPTLNPFAVTRVSCSGPGERLALASVSPVATAEYAGAVPHRHGIFGDGTHRHEFFHVVPYVKLCYVMFRYTYPGAF